METNIKYGQKYGRLSVLEVTGKDASGHVRALCRCECGKTKVVRVSHLTGGKVKSCGCLSGARTLEQVERLVTDSHKHGGTGSRLYRIWDHMRRRRKKSEKNPCADVVTVCTEWERFDGFRAWAVESGYRDDLTLGRRDNDTGYDPENCVWIPLADQQSRRRNNVRLEYNGQLVTIAEASRLTGINRQTLADRLHAGMIGEDLFRPVKGAPFSQ
ncbi:hypothetical protein AAFA46_08455 [Oscillospiraceae bacterium WX1]